MAIDKVVDSTQLDQDLTSVANAIRTRGETSAQLTFPSGFVYAINAIPSGGAPEKKDVNFYDYEGTLLYSYTAAEFADLQAMPDNPTHEGLTAQGWNWTLQEAKTYVAAYGRLIIGQTYITSDGATRIYVDLVDGATSPFLGLTVNGTVTINWGDGSATDTVTGTAFVTTAPTYTQHQYATAGSYVISIKPATGTTFWLKNVYGQALILSDANSSAMENARAFLATVKKIHVGDGLQFDDTTSNKPFGYFPNLEEVTIPNNNNMTALVSTFYYDYSLKWCNIPRSMVKIVNGEAFSYCFNLRGVSLPPTLTDFGSYGYNFDNCTSLKEITLPSGITQWKDYMFRSCSQLESIIIPPVDISSGTFSRAFNSCQNLKKVVMSQNQTGLTESNSAQMFYGCTNLREITLPPMTGLGAQILGNCVSLQEVTIPSDVTIIKNSFYGAYSLSKITVPGSVTEIQANAFYGCRGLKEIHLLPTTPPTLANTNAFTNIHSNCVFYVPRGSLEDYQTASNWATYANKMQEEPL